MAAEGLLLPELDALRHDAAAGPEGRARHGAERIAQGHPGAGLLEFVIALHGPRLLRSPGADLAQARPGGEVGVGLGVGHALDRAADAHLAAEGIPVEAELGAGIGLEVGGLGALQVGIEDEAALVGVLEQHHAHRGAPPGVGRGQGHGGGLLQAAPLRVVEPGLELDEGIGHGRRGAGEKAAASGERGCSDRVSVAIRFHPLVTDLIRAGPSPLVGGALGPGAAAAGAAGGGVAASF